MHRMKIIRVILLLDLKVNWALLLASYLAYSFHLENFFISNSVANSKFDSLIEFGQGITDSHTSNKGKYNSKKS